MIEFKGRLGEKAKEFIVKMFVKRFLVSASILTIVIAILAIVLALTIEPLISLFMLAVIPFWFCIFLPKSKSFQNQELPFLCVVDIVESTVVIQGFEGKNTERFCMIEDVKRVDDYGDWYHMIIPKQDMYFIFQKDLITQGTIEEFEKIFEGKIVHIEK